mmetsp:Transcript_24242/g.40156  ORF Transcript_24242/g.40156 Transcript_24242/m.40156 type:complete len:157 (-) Transcript_24242:1947-2417(-)
MSVAPGDPLLDLMPQVKKRGFNLFSCCVPKEEELEQEEEAKQQPNEEDNGKDLVMPVELVVEEVKEQNLQNKTRAEEEAAKANSVIVAFLQMFFAFLLLNFKDGPKAIMSSDATKKDKREKDVVSKNEQVYISKSSSSGEGGGFEVEDVPEIEAAE